MTKFKKMGVSLPKGLAAELDEYAAKTMIPRSRIIAVAVKAFLEERKRGEKAGV